MTLYAYTIGIDEELAESETDLVAHLLNHRNSLMLLVDDQMITVRDTPNELICELIDTMPNSHRCVEEFKVLVENAKRSLADSELARYLPRKTMQWRVVENGNNGRVELWPGPYNDQCFLN